MIQVFCWGCICCQANIATFERHSRPHPHNLTTNILLHTFKTLTAWNITSRLLFFVANRIQQELEERNAATRRELEVFAEQSVLSQPQLYEADREVVTTAHGQLSSVVLHYCMLIYTVRPSSTSNCFVLGKPWHHHAQSVAISSEAGLTV